MRRLSSTFLRSARRYSDDEAGATSVEYAMVMPLFLLLLLGIVDFGRYSSDFVMVQKAMERGARIAAVRPPACPGVPETHVRIPNSEISPPPKFGTSCSVGGICANPGIITCGLNLENPTAAEIWNRINAVMPSTVAANDVTVSYAYDQNLGFLGGPYVPVVTVELTGAEFDFVTPLGGLATMASGALVPNGARQGLIPFPDISVTLPGEDLNLGSNG